MNWNSNYSDQLGDYLKEMWGFIRRYGEYKLNLDLNNLYLIFFLSIDQVGQNCEKIKIDEVLHDRTNKSIDTIHQSH